MRLSVLLGLPNVHFILNKKSLVLTKNQAFFINAYKFCFSKNL